MADFIGLAGHTSEDTAYVVDDYPYGFRERTQIRYWLEFRKGHGFRHMAQTLNPKTGRWNKPKASTYADVMVLCINQDSGHVQTYTLRSHDSEDAILRFESLFADVLTDDHIREIRALRVINRASSFVTYTIGTSDDKPRQTVEEQREIWRRAVAVAAHQINAE